MGTDGLSGRGGAYPTIGSGIHRASDTKIPGAKDPPGQHKHIFITSYGPFWQWGVFKAPAQVCGARVWRDAVCLRPMPMTCLAIRGKGAALVVVVPARPVGRGGAGLWRRRGMARGAVFSPLRVFGWRFSLGCTRRVVSTALVRVAAPFLFLVKPFHAPLHQFCSSCIVLMRIFRRVVDLEVFMLSSKIKIASYFMVFLIEVADSPWRVGVFLTGTVWRPTTGSATIR